MWCHVCVDGITNLDAVVKQVASEFAPTTVDPSRLELHSQLRQLVRRFSIVAKVKNVHPATAVQSTE
jgi:hypothetical protein